MFRPLTVIAITAFCVVGWNVYRAEDAARHLDRELRDLQRRTEQARDRTQVLKAEWALLNEPERLRQVAQKYLPLETMVPGQFLRLQELERKLPTAVAFAGPVNLFAPAPGTAIAASEPAVRAQAMNTVVAAAAMPALVAAARATTPAAPAAAAPQVAARPAPRPEPAHAEPARPAPAAVAAAPAAPPPVLARAEEPRRRLPVPVPVQRAETVALREAAPMVARREAPAVQARELPVREVPVREMVAETRPGLLRQALHMPISSANAAPVPGTGGRIGAPSASGTGASVMGGSSLGGSSLGGAVRGGMAPPVPLPAPVPVR